MLKEEYFNIENIEKLSLEIQEELSAFTGKRNKPIADNSILIVIDSQKYFTDSTSHAFVPSSVAVLEKIGMLIEVFESKGLPVIFTRHYDEPEKPNQMLNWWKGYLKKDSEFFQLANSLNSSKHTIIDKCNYDIFHETNLDELLTEKNIQNVYICGFMTNLCCETSARSAFIRNYKPYFLLDATATYNLQLHKSTLFNLAHGFTFPILTKELTDEFGNS